MGIMALALVDCKGSLYAPDPALFQRRRPCVEVAAFLTNAKKARRLNNYVFSLLRACAPQDDRLASIIKRCGVVVHSIKYPVTPSLLNHLPLKGDEDGEEANEQYPSMTTDFGHPTPGQAPRDEDVLNTS